jgi:hypothetical protein
MAEKKPHLYFRNPVEGVVKFKQKTRYGAAPEEEEDQEDDEEEEIDYSLLRESFTRSRTNYIVDKRTKEDQRNPQLAIPATVELVELVFFNSFDSIFFENRYRTNFGLSPVRYSEFNTRALFAVINETAFANFLENIQIFINTTDHSGAVGYNTDIKYIREFLFYSPGKVKKYERYEDYVLLNLIDNPEIFTNKIRPIENELINYLRIRQISFSADLQNNRIEIFNQPEPVINEILNNFDVIQSANSFLAGVIGPSAFNTPIRSHGFTISNAADTTLPIIGIIDTGISSQSPIAVLTVNTNNDFDLTGTSALDDSADHGTAVATLASLGKRIYPNHTGDFEADARLLSIKILGGKLGVIPQTEVLKLIRKAHTDHGVKIFTLTIAYTTPKADNSNIADYSYSLDMLAYELDILIFVSVGNNDNLTTIQGGVPAAVTYPTHFEDVQANLCVPSDSMNNISIGSAAGNLEGNDTLCISPNGEHPAIYTRKHHINWNHPSINKSRINKQLLKPDLMNYAGDFDARIDPTNTGLRTLSISPGVFYIRQVGSSYSGPLTANLAAKLLRHYPALIHSMQTVKALILNCTTPPKLGNTFSASSFYETHLTGRGIPDDDKCLFSDENTVTFVLEDSIKATEIKAYPIHIPDYLNTVERKNSLLQVDITLYFKFKPIPNNHLTYCPLHTTFGLFRNKPLQTKDAAGIDTNDGLNGNKMANIKFKASWAQDYYYKPKLLSNSQKMSFVISRKELLEETNSFKIAVHSKFHKLLSPNQQLDYAGDHPFSIVITLRENPIKGENTGRLYNELIAVNTTEAFAITGLDGEAIIE